MSTQFNLGPGGFVFQEVDPVQQAAQDRAERVESLAETLFVEWLGKAGGFLHPLDDGIRGQVRDAAATARECAAIFVDGGRDG